MEATKMLAMRLFCVAIFCFSGAIGELCLDDVKCLTDGANTIFPLVVPGPEGKLDPIQLDFIEDNVSTLKYKLYNASLSGLKNCHVDLMRLSLNDTSYNYNLGCPHVTMEAHYEMKGNLGSKFVEGKGTCKIDHYDYNFLFRGNYDKIVKDGQLYTRAANHILDIKSKGKVHYDFKNLYFGDKNKSDEIHKFANENWQFIDESVRGPAMNAFIGVFFRALNAFLDVTPSAEHFSKKT